MLYSEYAWELHLRKLQEEGLEEGLQKGLEEGRQYKIYPIEWTR